MAKAVLILAIAVVACIGEFTFPSESIEKYFSSLEEKNPPLHICTGISDVILYRIPPFKTCKLPDKTNNTSGVEITIWWEDITGQSQKKKVRSVTLRDQMSLVCTICLVGASTRTL